MKKEIDLKIYAIEILKNIKEDHNVRFLEETLEKAIKQVEDLEHFSHYTSGLWCTDRPDLLDNTFKKKYIWQINFWEQTK